ncbi:MAG TPA: hypothetical protein VGZ23_02460 [bacterium]|nr:hypothetical protein [bacterium]
MEQTKEPLRRAILTRFLRAAGSALSAANTGTLTKAASADSDLTAVLATLEASLPDADSATDEEVIARAQLGGLDARQQVLEAEGGTLSAEQMARRLHLTRQAVDLRRTEPSSHWSTGGPARIAWQLGPVGIWPWVPQVIHALAPHDPWQQVFFLLSPHPDLEGETPLHALGAGRIDEVVALARTYAAYGLG